MPTKKELMAELRRKVNATKCPKCGGFAIPSATLEGTFVCKDHGRFVPKEERP